MNRSSPTRQRMLVLALAVACAAGGARDVAALPGIEASAFSHIARGTHAPAPPRKSAAKTARPAASTWVVSNCNDAGAGSLRDIVDHFAVDGDTVDMTALTCGSITLTTGSIFTAANNLTFEGPTTSTFFITGGDALRLFGHLGSGTLTFRHLVLSHGYAQSSGINDAAGGCIASYGTVSLDHVVAKYCKAGAAGNGAAAGGAVFALNVEARDSVVKYNDARANQGVALGGGLFAMATAAVDYSTISGNQAFANNTWLSDGGGVLSYYGGALRMSTVSNNEAGGAGGVAFVGGHSAISQSTISGNSSLFSAIGAGVHVQSAFPVFVENSTITGNIERNNQNNRYGAGLHLAANTQAVVISSIIAGNRLDDGTALLWFSDVGGETGSFVTGDHNLAVWSRIPLPADTRYTLDPGLGPLQDNGGPTFTHALRSTSPALEAGFNFTGVPFDQRGSGFARVIGANADIGAVEFNLNDLIFADDFE